MSCSKPDEEDREIEYNNKNTQEKSKKTHRDLPTYCASDIIPQGPTIYTRPIMIKDFKLTNLNNNCVQFESEFDKMFKKIINQASKSGISLRIFNKLAPNYQASPVLKTAFIEAASNLYRLIKTTKYPKYVRKDISLQQLISGRPYYIIRGEEGFEALADQTNVHYGGIIYVIRCKLQFGGFFNNLELIYIGRTWKTKKQRFIDHVWDAVKLYVKTGGENSRYIEKLIITAIKYAIRENPEFYSKIPSFDVLCKNSVLNKNYYRGRKIINKIADVLYKQYFTMEIIEVHLNNETTGKRESHWIKNYPRKVNGQIVEGTKHPRGLNMIDHETKVKSISLPIYDIIFAISLGFNGPEINKMLRSLYNIRINKRQIYSKIEKFFKNWDHGLELFFKPIIQRLLESPFDWNDIAITIRKHPSYRGKTNFKNWFYNLNTTQLRIAIRRDDFNWDNLKTISSEIFKELSDENKIKGIFRDVWIEWFIVDKGEAAIAAETGYRNAAAFNAAWIKQGRRTVFQKNFASTYTGAVEKFRKKRMLEILTNQDFTKTSLDSRLYWIYVNEFRLTGWEDLKVRRPSQGLRNCNKFFENLFSDEGLTSEDLERISPDNFYCTHKYSALKKYLEI